MEHRATSMRPDIARISPELALVDEELARRVRHRVPRKLPGRRPPLPILRLAPDPAAIDERAHESTG